MNYETSTIIRKPVHQLLISHATGMPIIEEAMARIAATSYEVSDRSL